MLKICRKTKTFTPLQNPTLAAAAILERDDLQEYIFNSPGAFFEQLGERLFILGKEVVPSETVDDRIDLLAIDEDGRAVVIELKRGSNKFQHLQAIAYAGMISKWTQDDFIVLAGPRADELRTFVDETTINNSQRILLVAEDYDFEVLAGAEWLWEQYGVEIKCARIKLAVDQVTAAEYMSCAQVFPLPELAEQAAKRSRGGGTPDPKAAISWNQYLDSLQNDAVMEFARQQLGRGCENNPRSKQIYFRANGKRRWHMEVWRPCATVWQQGRFEGDVTYWSERLSDEDVAVKGSRQMQVRFFLRTAADFAAFMRATEELESLEWFSAPGQAASA